jgi:hypothetical protein
MFRARHKSDFKTLRVLHLEFTELENHSAALLCLDPVFTSTLLPHGASTADPGPEISFHPAYFELLDRLRREDHLDAGSVRQKVFAFQPRRDDRFFIPANSFLHAVFLLKPDTVQVKEGCIVTHEWLRRVLDHEILEYIRLREKQQRDAYRRWLGAAPSPNMVADEYQKAGCQLQPEQVTVSWFNARTRLHLEARLAM